MFVLNIKEYNHMKKILILILLVISAGYNSLSAQQSIEGRWDGAITIMNQDIKIIIQFSRSGDSLTGKIDIPQQGAAGVGLSKLKYEHPKLSFELPVGPGNTAYFNGEKKDSLIEGDFQQMQFKGTFNLSYKGPIEPDTVKELPVNYKTEEVTFLSDSIKLAGTLTIPEGSGRFPAVILITGSGPQNRDEELFGFKPFKIIADHLTRNGIAVLRYDDRGVGESKGNMIYATTEDFTRDALAAFRFLSKRKEINAAKIGMLGHSEGGIIAPLAASRNNKIDFIVLMSGSGVPGKSLLKEQLRLILKASGADSAAIDRQMKMQGKIVDAVVTDKGWNEVRKEIRESVLLQLNKLDLEQRKALGDENTYINRIVEAQLRSMNSPWFKYFLSYDPAKTLRKVKCPVLLLFGELDTQVSAEQNKDKMVNALKEGGNKNYRVEVFPKANHLYQEAESGSPNEYVSLKKEFVPGFLDTITKWIKENTSK